MLTCSVIMCIVMEYDTSSGKWATLPPYRLDLFTLPVINNQLVLVGGTEGDLRSKGLGVLRGNTPIQICTLHAPVVLQLFTLNG